MQLCNVPNLFRFCDACYLGGVKVRLPNEAEGGKARPGKALGEDAFRFCCCFGYAVGAAYHPSSPSQVGSYQSVTYHVP
jgi:hypothetical protein